MYLNNIWFLLYKILNFLNYTITLIFKTYIL
jgi:hypothetical protein